MAVESDKNLSHEASLISTDSFIEASADAQAKYGRFNLAIIGGTGVGKSSLVNAVFGRDQAKVGKGLPVTKGVHYYCDKGLGIWDFEGFEIGSATSPAETLRDHLNTVSKRPANEQISVVWYCVTANADRLTVPDVEMIRALDTAGLPVILVLTKVNWTRNPLTGTYKPPKGVEEFRGWLEDPIDEHGISINIPIRKVILTAAIRDNGKGVGHGVGDLVTETLSISPDNEKDAFRIAQRLNLRWKREMARPVIAAATAASAAAAAVPIPVADAATLAPIQLAMMGRISMIYDLEMKTMLSASAVAQLGAQIAGKALARSFIKLIPGVGSVVNATVAAAITASSGEGWMRLCERIHTGKLDISQTKDLWSDFSPSLVSVMKNITKQGINKS